MGTAVLKVIIIDKDEDKGGLSFEFAAAPVDEGVALTSAIVGLSDGQLYQRQLITLNEYPYTVADMGASGVEHRGHIKIKQMSTGRKWVAAIPAINISYIDRQGKSDRKVTADGESAVLAGFATSSGIAVADLKVVNSWISEQNYRR